MMVVDRVRVVVVTVVQPYYSESPPSRGLRATRIGAAGPWCVCEVACGPCCALRSCHADVMRLDADVRHGLRHCGRGLMKHVSDRSAHEGSGACGAAWGQQPLVASLVAE